MYFTHFLWSTYADSRRYFTSTWKLPPKSQWPMSKWNSSFPTKIVSSLFQLSSSYHLWKMKLDFFSLLSSILPSWKWSHLGFWISSLDHKGAIKQMTVSRSLLELMHQLMMGIYPSMGDKNHQIAFLLCALFHGLWQ